MKTLEDIPKKTDVMIKINVEREKKKDSLIIPSYGRINIGRRILPEYHPLIITRYV